MDDAEVMCGVYSLGKANDLTCVVGSKDEVYHVFPEWSFCYLFMDEVVEKIKSRPCHYKIKRGTKHPRGWTSISIAGNKVGQSIVCNGKERLYLSPDCSVVFENGMIIPIDWWREWTCGNRWPKVMKGLATLKYKKGNVIHLKDLCKAWGYPLDLSTFCIELDKLLSYINNQSRIHRHRSIAHPFYRQGEESCLSQTLVNASF